MFSVAAAIGRPRLFALRAGPRALRRGLASSAAARSVDGPSSADAEGAVDAGEASGPAGDAAGGAVEAPVLNKGAGAGQKTVAERTREYLARTAPKTPREAVDRKLAKHEWIRPRINPNVLLHGKDSVPPESVYEHPYRPFRMKDFASIQAILDVPDPILDTVVQHKIAPSVHIPKAGEIQWRNINPDTSGPIFRPSGRGISPNQTDELEQKISEVTPLSIEEVRDLHRYTVTVKRVVHQSHKGRVASFFVMVVAGNGRGMVGYGQGKASMPRDAFQMALVQAVKSMDFIERFEGRTIPMVWERKFGATKLILRPRPAGFGLRIPPSLHGFCKAAGIQDLSADIIGSANPMNVVKCAAGMLYGGHNPIGYGNAYGRDGSRMKRGSQMPSIRSIELNRGRRLIAVR